MRVVKRATMRGMFPRTEAGLRWPSHVHVVNSFKLFISTIKLPTRKAVLMYTSISCRKQCSPLSPITHNGLVLGAFSFYLFIVNSTVKNLHVTTILIFIYLMTRNYTAFILPLFISSLINNVFFLLAHIIQAHLSFLIDLYGFFV